MLFSFYLSSWSSFYISAPIEWRQCNNLRIRFILGWIRLWFDWSRRKSWRRSVIDVIVIRCDGYYILNSHCNIFICQYSMFNFKGTMSQVIMGSPKTSLRQRWVSQLIQDLSGTDWWMSLVAKDVLMVKSIKFPFNFSNEHI